MGIAFRVLWAAFKDYYEEMFTLAGANLLWVVLSIPVITLPATTAGMLYLTNQIAHHRRSIEFRMFFEGIKLYWWKSYLLAGLNVLAAVIFYTNFRFYGQFEGQWAVIVRGLFVGLAAMWALIQVYVFPMLLEQEEPKLRMALRNAAFLTFASPITTLTLVVLLAVVAAISVGLTLPFAVAMMAVLGLAANEAVLALLIHFKIRQPPEELAE